MRTHVAGHATRNGTAGGNLALATAAFALTLWAWNLVGPLSRSYADALGLTNAQTTVLVSLPTLSGAGALVAVGLLADRFGGRVTLAAVCLATAVPTLLLGVASTSYGLLVLWTLLLGVAGASFAAGLPFVASWFPSGRRGFATGVFGAGMVGMGLSTFLTPRLVTAVGAAGAHLLLCAALVAMGVVTWVFGRDAPEWRFPLDASRIRVRDAFELAVAWRAALLYAVAFGGVVAFTTALPTLLTADHAYTVAEAALRTTGFAVVAMLARACGGLLSDRIGAARVCVASFVGTGVFAVALALHPPAGFLSGVAFTLVAASLGLGTGGVMALVAEAVDPRQVGTVSGMAGAGGALGGFLPPVLLTGIQRATGEYTLGFVLLAITALAVAVYAARTARARG
ncbi:MFS transporter [Nocardiopsis sp. CNR-923]|uniref:MFS transporter n=1 Tax=Nocardiopsis sp. CNR-923 TaxID=1904965 RepID=UPI00096981C1|nr:MFS transporter [Nocardiopsis sp. CNR-923]OLT29329.1 MFS transporter [Nocardiopsis sp. CNR-923]